MHGIGYASASETLFSWWQSTHVLMFPSFFGTKTISEAHPVPTFADGCLPKHGLQSPIEVLNQAAWYLSADGIGLLHM